jgi:hypothetical protein
MADLFFFYASQAGVLSFDSRDSRGVIMDHHGMDACTGAVALKGGPQ